MGYMRRVYFIPNAITALGLACGLFVILKVNMVERGFSSYQLLYSSTVLLLMAALADLLDGAVARIIHAESEFGAIFDSLADAISFGVAPAVLFLKHLSLEQETGLSFFAVIGAMLYALCGVLRLVRFNVKAMEAKGHAEKQMEQKRHFTGLPITAAAIAALSPPLFLASPLGTTLIHLEPTTEALLLTSIMIILGYFMVSKWKFPSLKALHFRIPSFQLVFFTVIIAIFFLYGILHFLPAVLLILSWGYIALASILSGIRLLAGKKSKTLEDFEPDQDDL